MSPTPVWVINNRRPRKPPRHLGPETLKSVPPLGNGAHTQAIRGVRAMHVDYRHRGRRGTTGLAHHTVARDAAMACVLAPPSQLAPKASAFCVRTARVKSARPNLW